MPTQDFTSQEPPMPRDYNPGGSDAKITRTIDSHDPEGENADERRNSHDL